MRQIKFRYYVSYNNLMKYSDAFDDLVQFFAAYRQADRNDASPILMQHTGLKDSEGNCIYEGDIVKGAWSDDVRPMIVIYQPPEFVMKVSLKSKRWSQFIIHYEDNQLYKVIGNLYQHGELLNEQI